MNTGDARDVARVPRLAELGRRLTRCPDLDTLVGCALAGLAEVFGYEHSLLLLLDETSTRLYTIASHGYETQGIGSEVRLGEGIIGMAAARVEPMRVGNLGRLLAYARTVRRSYEAEGGAAPGNEIALPGLADAESQLAVPAVVLGQLVGVLAVESRDRIAFDAEDEDVLSVVAALVASAIEIDLAGERESDVSLDEASPARTVEPPSRASGGAMTRVRFFAVDGSTFLDDEYLIKGVAGRILFALLSRHEREGRTEFTNKELRLDPSLELPPFRDNLDSRLILLKRRLDERDAPVRIEKAGRGRVRLVLGTVVHLECVGSASA
ncbi:MAG TPA: GAF domain-containing protein [Acidimicrobiia bacterium]|nr:GAF domain-containing protein [Acidimicrobiia bacterium]